MENRPKKLPLRHRETRLDRGIDAGLLYREWDEDDELTDELHRIAREHRDDD